MDPAALTDRAAKFGASTVTGAVTAPATLVTPLMTVTACKVRAPVAAPKVGHANHTRMLSPGTSTFTVCEDNTAPVVASVRSTRQEVAVFPVFVRVM